MGRSIVGKQAEAQTSTLHGLKRVSKHSMSSTFLRAHVQCSPWGRVPSIALAIRFRVRQCNLLTIPQSYRAGVERSERRGGSMRACPPAGAPISLCSTKPHLANPDDEVAEMGILPCYSATPRSSTDCPQRCPVV